MTSSRFLLQICKLLSFSNFLSIIFKSCWPKLNVDWIRDRRRDEDDVSICIFSITHFDYESIGRKVTHLAANVESPRASSSHESFLTSSDDRLMKSTVTNKFNRFCFFDWHTLFSGVLMITIKMCRCGNLHHNLATVSISSSTCRSHHPKRIKSP